jgi:hypothetical protein
MKLLSKFALALVVVGLIGVSSAQAAKPDKKKNKGGDTVQGTVAAALDASGALKISSGKKKSPTEVTVQTDTATEVTLDGQKTEMSKLAVGTYVTVTKSGEKATKIEASTTAPEKKKKNK